MVRIEVPSAAHRTDHKMAPAVGPPNAWKTAASREPTLLFWKSHQIKVWLHDNGYNDPNAHLAHRIQAFNWCGSLNASGTAFLAANTIGGMHTYCANNDFRALITTEVFDMHTPYIVPGWYVEHDSVCIMFTAINMILHWYCASKVLGRHVGVMGAIDHTYKVAHSCCFLQTWCRDVACCCVQAYSASAHHVLTCAPGALTHTSSVQMDCCKSPHLAFSILRPDQSVHRVTFGTVSSESADVTSHAFTCVRQHAENDVEWYALNGVRV